MKESFEDRMSNKFRKELENYQVPFDQQAWERLREDLPVKPVSRWGKWTLLAGLAFGIIVAGFIMYQSYWSTNNSIEIRQPKQNSTSTNVKKENVQSGRPTAGHSIDFRKKIQGRSETSVPNETTKRRLITKQFLIPEQENEPINNETEKLTNEVPELEASELLLAKEGLMKEPEMKLKLEKLPSKNVILSETKKQKLKFRLPKLNLGFSSDRYSHFVGPNRLSLYYNVSIR